MKHITSGDGDLFAQRMNGPFRRTIEVQIISSILLLGSREL